MFLWTNWNLARMCPFEVKHKLISMTMIQRCHNFTTACSWLAAKKLLVSWHVNNGIICWIINIEFVLKPTQEIMKPTQEMIHSTSYPKSTATSECFWGSHQFALCEIPKTWCNQQKVITIMDLKGCNDNHGNTLMWQIVFCNSFVPSSSKNKHQLCVTLTRTMVNPTNNSLKLVS